MVRKGIHPLLKRMTVVFRNGASIRVPTVANKPAPYILQTVSGVRCDVFGGEQILAASAWDGSMKCACAGG